MLKLSISEEVEKFRGQLQAWLKKHKPPKLPKNATLDDFAKCGSTWQRELAADCWVGVHWPKEFGGRSLSLVEEAIVQEELARVGAPQLLGLFGLSMVGPVLIKHGSEAQKQRYLSKILSAEEIWCQGFSEPGAGSDLAAIKTKAVVSDQGFSVSGQKIWTSFAHVADWCFLLCRTSLESKKHEGLSYLLVDMKSKGISTRPLQQMSGDREFNEVFFDDVFVPRENLVGGVGEGWKIAISTLMHERVVLTFARQLQSEAALRQLLKRSARGDAPQLKKELAFQIAQACAVRAMAYEHLVSYAGGAHPGPEGSLDKLLWSESFQEVSALAMQFDGIGAAFGTGHPLYGENVHRYLYSRGRTIAAGTSEIQRSIIAERVLGLPRLRVEP